MVASLLTPESFEKALGLTLFHDRHRALLVAGIAEAHWEYAAPAAEAQPLE